MKRPVYGLLVLVTWFFGSGVQAHEGRESAADDAKERGAAPIDRSLLRFSGLHELLNTHPAFVRFPIALFPSALLPYGLGPEPVEALAKGPMALMDDSPRRAAASFDRQQGVEK